MSLNYDLVCLSHLRWNFVYQRPHHLLSRFARRGRVFYIEEPLALNDRSGEARLDVSTSEDGITVVVPRLPAGLSTTESERVQALLLATLFPDFNIGAHVVWFYTPMAISLTRYFPRPLATVYDCMDELSAFQGAPQDLQLREKQLFRCADLVFTGGRSLYEAKQRQHHSVHLFASSVDAAHFAQARTGQPEPGDQIGLLRPRIGYFGVLDERLDVDLIAAVADLRPAWQLVLLGPTSKIDASSLPRRANIHYLGAKQYADLPRYLGGWDVAIIPFARNAATRFISPTKTPEYLAAGCPVVSTSIRDVVKPYAELGLVRIADGPAAFVEAVEAGMRENAAERLAHVDDFLAASSWERTWSAMVTLLERVIQSRIEPSSAVERAALALAG